MNRFTRKADEAGQRRGRGRRALRLLVAGRSDDATLLVSVLNISSTGMLVEAGERLAEGERFTCELPHAGTREARVIWCSGNLAGCSFDTPISDAAVSSALLLGPPEVSRAAADIAPFQASADFPARLREVRQARGLGLEDLANLLDLSKQTVWYWEKGRNLPSPQHLVRLNQVLASVPPEGALGNPPGRDELPALLQRVKEEIARVVGKLPGDIEISIRL